MQAKIRYDIVPMAGECAELDEADFRKIAKSLNAAFLSYYAFFVPQFDKEGGQIKDISTENRSVINCKMRRNHNGCRIEMEIDESGIYAKTQGRWITNTAKPYCEYRTESRKEAIERHLDAFEDILGSAYLLKRIA